MRNLNLLAISFWLTVVCCTSLPTEAAESYVQTINPVVEQFITIKNNKVLCSLQDENKVHMKNVIADIVETYSYDGEEVVKLEIYVQTKYVEKLAYLSCK